MCSIGSVHKVENKIPIDVEEYVQKLKPQLMEVVLHWLEGKRFHEIMILGEMGTPSAITGNNHQLPPRPLSGDQHGGMDNLYTVPNLENSSPKFHAVLTDIVV